MVLEEEKDFICRLKNRDNEAYIRLYDLYFSRLYRLAVHLVYGEEEAKDIVQQLFVDLFEKPVRLEGVRHLGAWLCMAVRNRCLNYLYVQDIEDKRKMLYLEAINEAGMAGGRRVDKENPDHHIRFAGKISSDLRTPFL